ncbi:MAG TPA: hypothetical protein VKE94_02230, partial [Gemmataceae bacterium]|nr:hypothetical protein [Gemmataceae bacterium]
MASVADRRSFLSFLTKGLLTVIGLLLAVPAIAYFWAPLRKRREAEPLDEGFADAGSVADLPDGQW